MVPKLCICYSKNGHPNFGKFDYFSSLMPTHDDLECNLTITTSHFANIFCYVSSNKISCNKCLARHVVFILSYIERDLKHLKNTQGVQVAKKEHKGVYFFAMSKKEHKVQKGA